MNVGEKRLPQDGRFDISDRDGESMDVRVSTFPTVYGEKVVMRLLEREALKPSLEDLNMNIEDLELFRDSIKFPVLVLIIGLTWFQTRLSWKKEPQILLNSWHLFNLFG